MLLVVLLLLSLLAIHLEYRRDGSVLMLVVNPNILVDKLEVRLGRKWCGENAIMFEKPARWGTAIDLKDPFVEGMIAESEA